MKHLLFILLLLPLTAFAQWPAAPNKIRLGNQTTGDGLVVRTDTTPSWTPSTLNNAWLAFDTVAGTFFYYDNAAWNELRSDAIDSLIVSNDTILLYTPDETFFAVLPGGTVTSVGTGFGLTGGPITSSGTIIADTSVLASKTYVTTRGYLTTEVDGSISNEGSLTVGAGTATTSIINSNTSGSTGVTIEVAGTGLAISESGNTITLTGANGIDSTQANNGLTMSGDTVQLGGDLTKNTTIDLDGRTFRINDGGTYPTFLQAANTDGFGLYSTASDFISITPALMDIGSTGRMNLNSTDTLSVTSGRIRLNAADTRIQQVTNNNALNRLMAIDSTNGRLYYVDKSSISSGTDANGIFDAANDGDTIRVNTIYIPETVQGFIISSADGQTAFRASETFIGLNSVNNAGLSAEPGKVTIAGDNTLFAGDTIRIDKDYHYKDNALNRLVALDSITGQLKYVDKASISSGSGTTDLSFSGSSSPVTLNSSTGTDVTFTAGTGISLSATSGNTTITNSAPDQTVSITGAGINVASGTYPNFTITGTEVDGSVSNEGSLTVGAGTATTSIINSNTSGSTGVTIEVAGTGLAISESGNTITLTGSGGSGTVTSVAAGVGLTASPSPITTTGTISADTATVLASKTFVTTRGYTTGTGTTNTLAKWTSSTALGNSLFTDDGTNSVAGGTASFRLPNGTTAQRPGSPAAGMTRYNTTLGYPETYVASAWLQSAFPTGTTGQTLRHDGTSWIANSVLTNNGTDVINTGAHRATTYASPTGSCAQPAGGHFSSTGGTGAIEVTLPVFDVTVFHLKFQVVVGSVTLKNQTFDISMYAQYGGSPTVFSQTNQHVIGGAARYTRNIRYGHDGTNIKVWIDELGTSWGAMTVQVVNVSFTRVSGNVPSAIDICKGWSISMENTAFNTVNQTRAFAYQPSRINGSIDAASNLDFFKDESPVLGGAYLGTFTGAIQINLPDSTLVAFTGSSGNHMMFELTLSSASVTSLRKIRIYGKYSYTNRSWSECYVSHVDGAFKNLTFRFGRENTVPVVYIGETSSSFTGLNVVIHGLETYLTEQSTHNALVVNAWGATTETSAFSNVTQTVTGVTAGALPYTTYEGYQYSENLRWDNTNTRLGIGNNAPSRTLHVTGEARITDLTTDNPTRIVGADADGDLGALKLGTNLSISGDTLNATAGAGVTNLAFSGSSSPVTLTSDTGTDVIFAAGSGLALSQSGGTATYSRTYSLTHITISGGSTFGGTTPERPDNDTPGTATTTAIGSDFSVSGSTIDYTGGNGALLRVEGTVSLSISDDTDIYLSIYKEGTEIAATSTRITCTAGNYYTVPLPATTITGNTNDTFEVRFSTASGTTTTTMHRYGFIIERIY